MYDIRLEKRGNKLDCLGREYPTCPQLRLPSIPPTHNSMYNKMISGCDDFYFIIRDAWYPLRQVWETENLVSIQCCKKLDNICIME
jgi:hypothetical protein